VLNLEDDGADAGASNRSGHQSAPAPRQSPHLSKRRVTADGGDPPAIPIRVGERWSHKHRSPIRWAEKGVYKEACVLLWLR